MPESHDRSILPYSLTVLRPLRRSKPQRTQTTTSGPSKSLQPGQRRLPSSAVR